MRVIFSLFLALLVVAGPAFAAELPPSVAKAESYLRGLTTARARFLQTAQDGSQALGTFYLNRPGKLRFEYDPPVKDFVVADGFFVYFYDSELGEQTNAPIGQTLADFLLRTDLRLSGDVTVTDVSRSDNMLHLTLVQTDDQGAGQMVMSFAENPFELKKWRVTDATGASVLVELFDLKTGMELAGNLFTYVPPKGDDKPRYNR